MVDEVRAATLQDVAREAGVSLATASRSLNGSTRKVNDAYRARVLAAAKLLNYSANLSAQAVARGRTKSIGLVISNNSSLQTFGSFPTDSGPADLFVYADDRGSRVDPSLALGVGFTAAVAKGYGLRWEIRDNIVGVQRVTSTIPIAGNIPPHERVYKHLFSMTVGFDVILERKRGRRY